MGNLNPSQIGSGLQIWASGSYTNAYSDLGTTPAVNSGTVEQWNDGSANARNYTQTTLANRPVYATNDNNGYNALQLTATKFMTASGPTNFGPIMTLEAVFKPTSSADGDIMQANRGVNEGWRLAINSSHVVLIWGGVAVYSFSNFTINSGTLYRAIVTCTGNGGTATLYLKAQGGSEQTQSIAVGTQTNISTQMVVGDCLFSASLVGDIFDVAAYNVVLAGADLTNLKTWADAYFAPASSLVVYPSTISAGFTGPIPLTLVGTSTTWTGGTTFTVSGVTGVSKTAQSVASNTLAGLTISEGSSTGTLTVSDGSASGTVTIQAAPSTSISPGGTWNGTAGSGYGGSPPTESATIHGSGFNGKIICNLDEPWDTGEWVTSDTTYTVLVEHGDPSWLASITVYLEGNTVTLDLTRRVKSSRTGAVGYQFTLPVTSFAQDGDVTGYVRVVPVNGYERLLTFNFTCNGKGTISRATRYIDPVNGNDSNNGQSSGTAWKTLNRAWLNGTTDLPSGCQVSIAPGTLLEDSNGNVSTVNNARQIRFFPSGGAGTVTVSRTAAGSPANIWRLYINKARFENLTFDMSKLQEFYGGNFVTFANCTISDPNGPRGPLPQQYYSTDLNGTNNLFRTQDGERAYACECTFSIYLTVGWVMYRNCNVSYSADAILVDTNSGKFACINSTFNKVGDFQTRFHPNPYLVVATKSFAAGSTTLTFSGSPSIDALGSSEQMTFDTGALSGQVFTVTSVTPASFTVVVTGDASGCAVGDHARLYGVWHSDTFQVNDPTNGGGLVVAAVPENFIISRSIFTGVNFQPQFMQAGWYAGAGTLSSTGTAVTTTSAHQAAVGQFVRLTNGTQAGQYARITAVGSSTTLTLESAFTVNQSGTAYDVVNAISCAGFQATAYYDSQSDPSLSSTQFQQAAYHVVERQITCNNKNWTYRNASPGAFGLSSCVSQDSIFYEQGADTTFPTSGLTVDTNYFITGTAQGTNAGGPGAVNLNTYKPTATSTALTKLPAGYAWTFPYDVTGKALLLDGTDYVGAAQFAPSGGGSGAVGMLLLGLI